jgi:DNA repair exonuclease SbcCD ATPase subunit
MSLRLRRIAIDNFRKFRQPVVIEDLTDGLNILIEPNETGKSTLLEALRAAFFMKYSTKSQLAQSYAPHGDAVGPSIQAEFELGGDRWAVSKRFLKSPMVEVEGPQGRAQGEEAEARLHTLLGSVKDGRGTGDSSNYGTLGLLWVVQADALEVKAPGQLVRDRIRSTLEAEVGSIMGGPAYQRVRNGVDEQFGRYWTPTAQRRGPQKDARDRLELAEKAASDAAARLAGLEQAFSDLEAERTKLKVVLRDIADDTDAQTRKDLVASLEIARSAAQVLATRKAEHEAADAKVRALEDLDERHRRAIQGQSTAQAALAQVQEQRGALHEDLTQAVQGAEQARIALEGARAQRLGAQAALRAGEARAEAAQRRAALAAARNRHQELLALEAQLTAARAVAATIVPAQTLAKLDENERAIAQAQAVLDAGATRIRGEGDIGDVLVDGEPLGSQERTITRETRIQVGGAEIVILPPPGTTSAQERLSAAIERLQAALRELGLPDVVAARASHDRGRDAMGEVQTLQARIAAATPADDRLSLAAGADALKALLIDAAQDNDGDSGEPPDIEQLRAAARAADDVLARAEGIQEGAMATLRRAEEAHSPLVIAEAERRSDLAHVTTEIQGIEARTEFATLAEGLADGRAARAGAAVRWEEAQQNAMAHDQDAIKRKIDAIDARERAASERRATLEKEIARLGGTIESEGGKGLAEREAAARDEVEAARAALERVTEDAETIKLLRDTLDEARNETSAKFVGPVAHQARRYIERLLPDCELVFSEELQLEAVKRAGVSEGCEDLSHGTQEQLAVLTRIAFADLLLAQGQPVSLILDDPFAYSDDARLDLMIEILNEVSERMQVIVLTCRDRAFRHVPATRLTLKALVAAA